MESATDISESSPLLCSSDVHPSEKARNLLDFRYSLVSYSHQRDSFLLVLRVCLLGSRHLAVCLFAKAEAVATYDGKSGKKNDAPYGTCACSITNTRQSTGSRHFREPVQDEPRRQTNSLMMLINDPRKHHIYLSDRTSLADQNKIKRQNRNFSPRRSHLQPDRSLHFSYRSCARPHWCCPALIFCLRCILGASARVL